MNLAFLQLVEWGTFSPPIGGGVTRYYPLSLVLANNDESGSVPVVAVADQARSPDPINDDHEIFSGDPRVGGK